MKQYIFVPGPIKEESKEITESYDVLLVAPTPTDEVISSVYTIFDSQRLCIAEEFIGLHKASYHMGTSFTKAVPHSTSEQLFTSTESTRIDVEVLQKDENRTTECTVILKNSAVSHLNASSVTLEEQYSNFVLKNNLSRGQKGFTETIAKMAVNEALFKQLVQTATEITDCSMLFFREENLDTTRYFPYVQLAQLEVTASAVLYEECYLGFDITNVEQYPPITCILHEHPKIRGKRFLHQVYKRF